MTPAEQLRAAKALIDTPEKWIKGEYAKGVHGAYASQYDDEAVCFCSIGAVERIEYKLQPRLSGLRYLRQAADDRGALSVVDFNDRDETTHADIMKLFDDAIALAEAGQ